MLLPKFLSRKISQEKSLDFLSEKSVLRPAGVKPATSMLKIIRAYCEAKSLDQGSLRFLFDGTRTADTATVASLDLEEGDW